jgi:hypothetical protein
MTLTIRAGVALDASMDIGCSQQRKKANECHGMDASWNKYQYWCNRLYTSSEVFVTSEMKPFYPKFNAISERAQLAEIEKEIAWNERRLEHLVWGDDYHKQTEDMVADLRQERQRLLAVLNG